MNIIMLDDGCEANLMHFPFANLGRTTRVFCFLDLDHPAVAWAVMRGMMVSADFAAAPRQPGFVSFMQAGMITALNNQRVQNEFLIEQVRSRYFVDRTSRMRGMYFFRSREDAIARIQDPFGRRISRRAIFSNLNCITTPH